MFARLWRWPTVQETQDAEGLSDRTRAWALQLQLHPKTAGKMGLFPLPVGCAAGAGIDVQSDPDDDGMCWFFRTPWGIEEWTDRPLPARTIREGAYRYEGRASFFNEDGTCPDHTGLSGAFATQAFRIPYRPGGYPLDRPKLIAEITRHLRAHAADVRKQVALQQQAREKRAASPEAVRAREAEAFVTELRIACGECVHPPEEQ